MSSTVAEILPGLLRFTVPFPDDPRRSVHSYVLVAGREALLVDAAWDTAGARAELVAALATRGLEPAAVRTVVITHLHVDHFGLAGHLRRLGARIGYHHADVMTLLCRYRRMDEFRAHSLYWERLNGYPDDNYPSLSSIEAVEHTLLDVPEPDLSLEGGEVLELGGFRLRPIWTPGHTMGHLCYYEETRRLLFTGDHVLPGISPHVGLYVHAIGNPLPNYLRSLELLQEYRPELVLPAHGEAFPDLHQRLDELLSHHHERMEEMFSIVGDRPMTPWEVAQRAHWTRRRVLISALAPFHRRMALAETMAHLDLLHAEGRLRKEFAPGLVQYRRPAAAGR